MQNELSRLLGRMVEDYTMKYLPKQELVDALRTMLSSQRRDTRTFALILGKALYKQLGPVVVQLLVDMNPAYLK